MLTRESLSTLEMHMHVLCICMRVGFLEKEIRKDGIPMLDTGENPDAPAPREMIDLEVSDLTSVNSVQCPLFVIFICVCFKMTFHVV